jgi:tetratricopeptide (TPR) repeat protein
MLAYRPVDRYQLSRDRDMAVEPAEPADTASSDELFLNGEHLEQYRHPTRDPEPYWQEALSRDPGDSRSLTALGKRALNRGEFDQARKYFLAATHRLTRRHPNPVCGEAHYHLGVTERWVGNLEAAYKALHKAAWNYEWRSCAYYQLATIDCCRRDWTAALEHLDASVDTNRHHNKALVLKALVLHEAADSIDRPSSSPNDILSTLLSSDPLDHWARHALAVVTGDSETEERFVSVTRNDAQTILDLAFDYSEAGFYEHAIDLINLHHASEATPVAVPNPLGRTAMTHYALAWLKARVEAPDATDALATARAQSADYLFPSRLEEMVILQRALDKPGDDPVAAYGLGNLLYDRRRHADAIVAWERASYAQTDIAQVYRNLGIAYWNHKHDGEKAASAYERALHLAPSDARLVCEYDQLAIKRNRPLEKRLSYLEEHRQLVLQRDDATVALAALYNLTGLPQRALDLITSRRFHPWEGGEGAVLRQYTTARLQLGQAALRAGNAAAAHEHFSQAMVTPDSLGEAYHALQAKADVNYWLGRSLADQGREDEACDHFRESAEESGDFTEMAVTAHSPLSYYRGLSLQALGRQDEANDLFRSLVAFGKAKLKEPAKIDYFATSLPNLLVFDEDLQDRRDAEARLLMALGHFGLGEFDRAGSLLEEVLLFDRSNQHAADLKRQLDQVPTYRE